MANHFVYNFEDKLPVTESQREYRRNIGRPLLGEVLDQVAESVSQNDIVKTLPERNQKLILDMSAFAVIQANHMQERWKENFWGLYVVGSRSRGDAGPQSDLDLLSVGTFYTSLGFSQWVFDGFNLDIPAMLPDEYNVGVVDRKYLVRAKPTGQNVLPFDLNVVDLTFVKCGLDDFKNKKDVAVDGSALPRIPLFELTVAQERNSIRF